MMTHTPNSIWWRLLHNTGIVPKISVYLFQERRIIVRRTEELARSLSWQDGATSPRRFIGVGQLWRSHVGDRANHFPTLRDGPRQQPATRPGRALPKPGRGSAARREGLGRRSHRRSPYRPCFGGCGGGRLWRTRISRRIRQSARRRIVSVDLKDGGRLQFIRGWG